MKKLLFLLLTLYGFWLSAQYKGYKPALEPYVKFLQSREFPTAKEYILEKFKTKDIVIISERDHRDLSQYDIIFDVLKDPRFKGYIYTEVGSANFAARINQILLSDTLSGNEAEQALLAVYRDMWYDGIWEKSSYFLLMNTVYQINKQRDSTDKIMLFPLDLNFNWKDYTCHEQYKLFDDWTEYGPVNRNEVMGRHFAFFYEWAKRHNRPKALVILNTYHGYIRIPPYKPNPTMPNIYSTGEFIYKTYPNITTNIYVNYYTQGFAKGLTNNGLFDAAFAYTGKDNIGFDLTGTPFGRAPFDLYNFGGSAYAGATFDYIFDGMIFYKPVSEMDLTIGIPNIYPRDNPTLREPFYRRVMIMDNISYEQAVKENQEFLDELNKIRHIKLPKKELKKIKEQIEQWLIK